MKHETRKPGTRKGFAALVALVLILCVTIGGTIAWITDQTDAVTNTFTAAKVTSLVDEDFDNGIKEKVAIENTGDIPAYIRAKVVYNWADSEGNVYAQTPVAGTDYTIDQNLGNWVPIGDYYYYNLPVGPGDSTGYLIDRIIPVEGKAPTGYDLQVTILAEAIQADGVGSDGKKAVEAAWGVDPTKLS